MRTRLLIWVRPVAAVLIFLVAIIAALTAGLLTPYFLAAWTTNILLLTISAPASFGLLAWAGTKLGLYFQYALLQFRDDHAGNVSSGSFIIGTSVALEIETGNGTITFLGTLNRDRNEIRGNYTVGGGTCDDTGTAVLIVSSPWDY